MADTTFIPQPMNDGFIGGGGIGALLIGSLLGGRGLLGNQGYGIDGGFNRGYAGAEMLGTNQILQSLNQNQMAGISTQIGNATQQLSTAQGASTQILTQDIFGSAQATQNAVNNGTLQGTISALQGQKDLTATILGSTMTNAAGHTNILGQVAASAADTNANINNARQSIGNDITNALGVIDSDIHGLGQSLESKLEHIQDDVNRASFANLEATHRSEINGMRNAFDTQRGIYDTANQTQKLILESSSKNLDATREEGSKTRDLINANMIQDLERELSAERNAHHHHNSTSAITLSNNSNTNVVTNALAQSQSQAQLNTLASTLGALIGQINSMNQVVVQMGAGNRSAANGVQV